MGDFDLDQAGDAVMLVAKDDGLGGQYLDIQAQLSNPALPLANGFLDFDDYNLLGIRVPVSALGSLPLLEAGDFNGDGTDDPVGLWGGDTFYYDGRNGLLPTFHADLSSDCLQKGNCLSFAPSTTSYSRLAVSDFNGDGYADLEASIPDPATDIYYGSPHGLAFGFPMTGIPTSDGDDGKFITMAVQPAASIGVPDYLFVIRTKHDPGVASGELHLEVFDGDELGSHDTIVPNGQTVHTCYWLYADPYQDGSALNEPPVIIQDESHFANNRWSTLLNVPADRGPVYELDTNTGATTSARVPGSGPECCDATCGVPCPPNSVACGGFCGAQYSYLLRTFLTTGSCNDEPTDQTYPTDAVANGFKIRVNGDIAFSSSVGSVNGVGGALSFRGSDAVGPFAATDGCTPSTCSTVETQDVDTTYDGRWSFYLDLTNTMTPGDPNAGHVWVGAPSFDELWIADADADSLSNLESPGNATGASTDINFAVQTQPYWGSKPLTFFQPPYPSGQYDPTVQPCVAYDVTNPIPDGQFPAALYWNWSKARTHNNIWIAVPTTAAPTVCRSAPAASSNAEPQAQPLQAPALVATLPIRGEPARIRIAETSATPASAWASSSARIAPYLPIQLGQADACGKPRGHGKPVNTVGRAEEILTHADGSADQLGKAVAALEAELLAAKLNLARGSELGETIERGYLYGTTTQVSDVVDRAGRLLAHACRGAGCLDPDPCGQPACHGAGCKPKPAGLEELASAVADLRRINAGQITYRAPVQLAPAGLAPNLSHHALIANGGNADFWRHD